MIQKNFLSVVFCFCALAAFSQENQKLPVVNDSVSLFAIYPKNGEQINAESIKKFRFISDSLKRINPQFKLSSDSLLVITPKNLNGSLIVVKPDSSSHYYLRNFYPKTRKENAKIPFK